MSTYRAFQVDVLAVEGLRPDPRKPVVPGHEVVGVIDALGEQVGGWSVGDRVGLGFLGGPCGVCVSCRRGGSAIENEASLQFSARHGVAPMTEVLPFEDAPGAYARMMSGQARFRVVLDMQTRA